MHGETVFDEADLHAFVDGRIEPARGAALAASLDADPEASARIDAWRRQTESLRTMFASALCEPVPVRLLPIAVPTREIRDAPAGHGLATPARRLAGVVATVGIGAALAGFALGALASMGTDGFGLAPPAAREAGDAGSEARDVAARAVEAHRTFIADAPPPVEPTGGTGAHAPKLTRPIEHRLGAGLHIPDLTQQGWTLVGGRIVPGRRGPAAFLTYADGTGSLGLFVSRGGSGWAGSPGSVARVIAVDDEAGSVGVAAWTDGVSSYALTSDRGREWLLRHIAPLRDAVRAQARASDEAAPAP